MFSRQVIDIADQVGLQVLFILSEHALGPLRLIVVYSGTIVREVGGSNLSTSTF
jgi:hypothetical protein